jgi:hypothetical protein
MSDFELMSGPSSARSCSSNSTEGEDNEKALNLFDILGGKTRTGQAAAALHEPGTTAQSTHSSKSLQSTPAQQLLM